MQTFAATVVAAGIACYTVHKINLALKKAQISRVTVQTSRHRHFESMAPPQRKTRTNRPTSPRSGERAPTMSHEGIARCGDGAKREKSTHPADGRGQSTCNPAHHLPATPNPTNNKTAAAGGGGATVAAATTTATATASELLDAITTNGGGGGGGCFAGCTMETLMEAFAVRIKGELADGSGSSTGEEAAVGVEEVVAATSGGDALILDVRSPGEFARGHLPGAANVPLFTDDERHKVGLNPEPRTLRPKP
jgi:hypothetical protein